MLTLFQLPVPRAFSTKICGFSGMLGHDDIKIIIKKASYFHTLLEFYKKYTVIQILFNF